MRFAPGIYAIDKPKGWTSFDVVKWVRCRTDEKKVGHGGTLDPNATGLLLVAVGKKHTKNLENIIGLEKEYEGEIVFGIETDTYDPEGEIVAEQDASNLDKNQVLTIFKKYSGIIAQVPPMFSAKKVKGKKLYELARKGEKIAREAKDVEIKNFQLTSFQSGHKAKASFKVSVSKGTYIRSLAHDIGQELGCGAILEELRRTRIGEYVLLEGAINPIIEKEKERCA